MFPSSSDSDHGSEDSIELVRSIAASFISVPESGSGRCPDSPPTADNLAPDFVAAVRNELATMSSAASVAALSAEAKAEMELLAQQERERKAQEDAEAELKRAQADLEQANQHLANVTAEPSSGRAPGTPVSQLLTPTPLTQPKAGFPQNAAEASVMLETQHKALVLTGEKGRHIPLISGKDGAPPTQASASNTLPPLPAPPSITPAAWASTKLTIVEQLKMQIASMDKGLFQAAVISEANADYSTLSDQAFSQKYAAAAGSDSQTWLTLCQNAAQAQLHNISAMGLQRAQSLPFADDTTLTLPDAPSVGASKRLAELRERKFHPGVVAEPLASASSTPQEPAAGRRRIANEMEVDPRDIPVPAEHPSGLESAVSDHTALELMSPPARSQDSFTQVLAASQGVDINDPSQVEAWLNQPVTSLRDVVPVLWRYHTDLVVAEVAYQCRHVTMMVEALSERTLELQEDLAWLKTQDRLAQKQRAQVMSVAAGFDRRMGPQDRVLQLEWMIYQIPELKSYCMQQPFFEARFQNADPIGTGAVLFVCLATDPITVKAGKYWSPLTLLVWRSFDIRLKFNARYQGDARNEPLWWQDQAVPGKHIKVSPSVPAFQRKLEAPLRVLLTVLNSCDQFRNNAITTLWPSLTVMTPQAAKEYDESHTAIARLVITESEGRCKATLYVLFDVVPVILAPGDAPNTTIWEQKWYEQFFGRQWQEDESERSSSEQMQNAVGLSKGSSKGRLNHWVNALTHTARPFPIPFSIVPVGYIPFEWSQYCRKMGRQDQESNPPAPPYRPSERNMGQFFPGQADSSGGDSTGGAAQRKEPYVTTTPPRTTAPSPSPPRATANGQGGDGNELQQVIGKSSAPSPPPPRPGKGGAALSPPLQVGMTTPQPAQVQLPQGGIDPHILAAQQQLQAKGKGSTERVSPPRAKGQQGSVEILSAGDWASKTWTEWSQEGQYTKEEWEAWKQANPKS